MTLANHVWCRIFLAKGIYNIAVSAILLARPGLFLPLLGAPPGNMAYALLFLWLALACGVAYVLVALDLDTNHGVVVLGVIGQLAVFGVLTPYWLKGSVYAVGLDSGIHRHGVRARVRRVSLDASVSYVRCQVRARQADFTRAVFGLGRSVRRRRRRNMRIALVRVARTAFVVEAFACVFVALVPAAVRIVG